MASLIILGKNENRPYCLFLTQGALRLAMEGLAAGEERDVIRVVADEDGPGDGKGGGERDAGEQVALQAEVAADGCERGESDAGELVHIQVKMTSDGRDGRK